MFNIISMQILTRWSYKFAACILLAPLIAGCANNEAINRSRDQVHIDVGRPSVDVRNMETGVFVTDNGILVKHNSRSFLSILDEMAYRVGGSYTVLSDLSQLNVSVFDFDKSGRKIQKKFQSSEEMIQFLVDSINMNLEKEGGRSRLFVDFRSDGPTLSYMDKSSDQLACYSVDSSSVVNKSTTTSQDCQKMSFKKIFLQNISSEEAVKSLLALFPGEIGAAQENTRIIEYKAQNALIIRGQDKQIYDRIAKLLPALDADFSQIIVETKVFQYSDAVDKKIGAMLGYTNGQIKVNNPFSVGVSDLLPNILFTGNAVQGRAELLSQFAFQDTDGLVRILAEPRLVLQSGRAASVSLNTDKYFITPGVNVSGDIKPLPTGVTFEVTPTVLGDRRVRLNLKIIQSEFVNNSETGVAAVINKNTIDTSVIANDGELISLGGILTRKDTQQSSGMTGMRKIPLLGYLFGSENESGLVSRVEFFIRPTINRSHERNEEVVTEARDANCKLEGRFGGAGCSSKNVEITEEIK